MIKIIKRNAVQNRMCKFKITEIQWLRKKFWEYVLFVAILLLYVFTLPAWILVLMSIFEIHLAHFFWFLVVVFSLLLTLVAMFLHHKLSRQLVFWVTLWIVSLLFTTLTVLLFTESVASL